MDYLDSALLEELQDLLGAEEIREVTALFAERFDAQLAELDAALAHAALGRVAAVAHGIKGAAANIGAKAVVDLAVALGRSAAAGDAQTAAALAAQLPGLFQHTMSELQARGYFAPRP